jgi:signal peptidase I
VFLVPDHDLSFVKRAVALPGDTVELRNGILHVNGIAAAREPLGKRDASTGISLQRYRETLPETIVHEIVERSDDGHYDNTKPVTVPDGFLFVLGDNRDNSLDSRVPAEHGGIGLVPMESVIGRATYIFWSNDLGRIGMRVE